MDKKLKKCLTALLMAATICVSMGCSAEQDTAGPSDPTEKGPVVPPTSQTQDVRAMMLDYLQIVSRLDQYTPGDTAFHVMTGDHSDSFSNNDGFRYCYERLLELEELDPWLNEADWKKYSPGVSIPNFDRESYLEKFTILEDVILQMDYVTHYTDAQKGTYTQEAYVRWHYNPNGTVCYIENGTWRLQSMRRYRNITAADMIWSYDENGRVSYAYFGTLADNRLEVTLTYDGMDRLILEEMRDPKNGALECAISYAYDTDGRLSRTELDAHGGVSYVTEYTYNEAGKVIREVEEKLDPDVTGEVRHILQRRVLDYFYSDDGMMAQVLCSTTSWEQYKWDEPNGFFEDLWVLTYDAQGNLLSRKIYDHVTRNEDGSVQPTSGYGYYEEIYIYGEKYVYGEYTLLAPSDQ